MGLGKSYTFVFLFNLIMTITIATLADAPKITNLVNTAYRGERSLKGWTTEAPLIDGLRIDIETVTDYLADSNVKLLKYTDDNDDIVGCVYLENRSPKLYLGMLSVMPELQANGIGRQLLHQAEQYAFENNFSTICMTVISTRAELLDWYVRRGYKKTGEILPFHVDARFGVPKAPINLLVLEKEI